MSDRQLRVPGAKSAMGAAEQIVSMMPSHEIYVEGFGGTGAVLRKKRPAASNWIIEKNIDTAAQLGVTIGAGGLAMAEVVCADFLELCWPAFGTFYDFCAQWLANPKALFYLDPPYVLETRRSQRAIYEHEFTERDHRRLCDIVSAPTVRARIMVSGYAGSLYEGLYLGWRREEFSVMTRGGPAIESVWMNFPPPTEFHDTRFIGKSFTDRQRIKRKAGRWVKRLAAMPAAERQAVLDQIKLWSTAK